MAPPRSTRSAVASNAKSEDNAVIEQGDSALVSAKRNFNYLINPSKAVDHPSRFRTRALLRSLHYITKFIFWRVVRYAKYVAIGSLVAAIGATAFGSVVTGVAWIAAPPTIGASAIAATVWWVGGFAARRIQKRWAKSRPKGAQGSEDEEAERLMDSPVRRDGKVALSLQEERIQNSRRWISLCQSMLVAEHSQEARRRISCDD